MLCSYLLRVTTRPWACVIHSLSLVTRNSNLYIKPKVTRYQLRVTRYFFFAFAGFFAPYLERPRLRSFTPWESRVPRMMW